MEEIYGKLPLNSAIEVEKENRMMSMKSDRSIGIWMITSIAVVFGLLTIKSGGSVLFIDGTFREEAGNYVGKLSPEKLHLLRKALKIALQLHEE